MSNISELIDQVFKLEKRIECIENLFKELTEKTHITDHSIDMVKVDEDDAEIETRTPIGYKPRK